MKYKVLFALLLLFASGCTQQEYVSKCIDLCLEAKQEGLDLSNGPCLSNDYYPDYVCDVAHNPRQDVDNIPSNQCPAYGQSAHHFVEVDEECNLIRVR